MQTMKLMLRDLLQEWSRCVEIWFIYQEISQSVDLDIKRNPAILQCSAKYKGK